MTDERSACYTQESLRMLETAEGQSNAVFACFGSAAQKAQLFEQSLSRFLAVSNRVVETTLSLADFDCQVSKPVSGTMGQLLTRLKVRVNFPDDHVLGRLDAALQGRNKLMHSFFLGVGDAMRSEAGRKALIAELLLFEEVQELARVTMNAMRIALCEAFRVPDPYVANADGV